MNLAEAPRIILIRLLIRTLKYVTDIVADGRSLYDERVHTHTRTHARTHAHTHTEAIVIIAGICCIFRNSVHYTRNNVFLYRFLQYMPPNHIC